MVTILKFYFDVDLSYSGNNYYYSDKLQILSHTQSSPHSVAPYHLFSTDIRLYWRRINMRSTA